MIRLPMMSFSHSPTQGYLLLGLIVFTLFEIVNMLKRNNSLLIDLENNRLEITRAVHFLTKTANKKIILFDELQSAALRDKQNGTTHWLDLSVTLMNGNEVTVLGFDPMFPHSLVAEKIKFLIEVIIWSAAKS